MISIAHVVLVTVTSLMAFGIAVGPLKLPAAQLRGVAAKALETVGFAAVFFALNALGWVIAVLGARAIFEWFMSVYLFGGMTIGMLSLFQGLILQRWWESSSGAPKGNHR